MSSSSPPKDPTPASPDFEFMETDSDDDDNQEMSSHPQLDPTLVYSPQPISSYDPNQPHLSPQPISSYNPNLTDMSNINSYDPETAALIQSRHMSMPEIMAQRQGLDQYNLPGVSNIHSGIDSEIASFMYSEGNDMLSEITRQKQALEYYNRTKQSLPQDLVGISRTESQVQEGNARDSATRGDGYKFLFDTSKNEAEDNLDTLKLLVRLRIRGEISPPEHVNKARFLRRRGKLETMYDSFVKKYPNGNRPLNRYAFSSKFEYLSYIMSRFIWGDYVIPSDGSSTSTGVDGSYDPDDYEDLFDPDAPFYHPDMKSYPYDPGYNPKKDKGPHSSNESCQNPGVKVDHNGPSDESRSNNSVIKVDLNGSYIIPDEELESDDPFFVDADDPDDPVLDRVKACFGSELKPTAAPVTRVSAAGKKLIFKAPRPPKEKSGRDRELEADTAGLVEVPEDIEAEDYVRAIEISLGKVPEDTKGKRTIDTLPEAIEIKQSKRRKLLDSPAKHDEKQTEEEEQRLLLPFANNEDDDDFDTLSFLYWYTLEKDTCILQRGAFVPNFENGVTEYINDYLPSSSKMTPDQCKKKVMELRETFLKFMELRGEEDLSEAEYDRFDMFRTVWGDGTDSGGSGSGADTNSCQKQNVDQGSKVEHGVNVGIAVQGAVGNVRDLDMNVDRGHVSAAGKARQDVYVESGVDRELEDDMARAMANSLMEVRDNTIVQRAIGDLKIWEADPGTDEGQVNVANIALDGGQENADKMDVDESTKK